ncbi:MAG: MoaD/ThiS family protein [Candidatus Binatia bacterium]|nr:MoaD/ThiS family protein [Candidatus Binatia bacterium]
MNVRLHASLRKYLPPGAVDDTVAVDLAPGASVADVIAQLGIPENHAKIAVVDGQQAELQTRLRDGQNLSLFPPLAG